MSVLKCQVNYSSNFALFLIVMTHNSSANFKVILFLLWTKGSHRSSNFDTFKCSGKNLPNFSSLFSNHKSVFLQNLHISLVSWKITPLYFRSSSNIYFGYKKPIKTQIFRLSSARVKICEIPHVNLKMTSQFLFIVMKHNSSANFKVIHFLLWAKRSHQSSNFDTCKCSGQNLSKSFCQFWNNNLIPLQILHPSSVLWKITPLYFFSSNNIYFAQKEPIKVKIFETFEYSG